MYASLVSMSRKGRILATLQGEDIQKMYSQKKKTTRHQIQKYMQKKPCLNHPNTLTQKNRRYFL